MASREEKDLRRGWAEEIRTAATWQTGPRQRKLINLADRIDPDVDSPESPQERLARQEKERAAQQAAADAEAEATARAAEEAAKGAGE